MRNWGVVSLPGDKGTIDVGINSAGLVNAFAPHIGQLIISEQAYWSSFSSLPSGEICDEMFQTRMQQKPPHSPGLTETIEVSMSKLSEAVQGISPQQLFSGAVPSKENLRKLSVGPVADRDDEVLELAKILFGWVIETMEIGSLRAALTVTGATIDKNLRQIKLLERLLTAKGVPESQARAVTAPLVGLNELRIGSAHIGKTEFEKSFKLLTSSVAPTTARDRWLVCVDAVADSLDAMAGHLGSITTDSANQKPTS
jgi:hypothetical protein